MKLLIVESPGKVKKIQSYLGADWTVRASVGHIRELSNEGNDHLGFELNGGVKCSYIPRSEKAKGVIAQLRQQAKQASEVMLATDPDREGETIAWHLADELRLKNPQRVTYTEITAQAIKAAIARPRPLDLNLVGAGRCRDCLDKLVGYKRFAPGLVAGDWRKVSRSGTKCNPAPSLPKRARDSSLQTTGLLECLYRLHRRIQSLLSRQFCKF